MPPPPLQSKAKPNPDQPSPARPSRPELARADRGQGQEHGGRWGRGLFVVAVYPKFSRPTRNPNVALELLCYGRLCVINSRPNVYCPFVLE
ncbi:hypothetical protein Mapa_008018 [Marchantia paleacea]|nr:hypothetical protein Mapa_008018 [Marchantia paleacea]